MTSIRQILEFFSEEEERDERGRWTTAEGLMPKDESPESLGVQVTLNHATTKEAAASLHKDGFDIQRGEGFGGLFGHGAYGSLPNKSGDTAQYEIMGNPADGDNIVQVGIQVSYNNPLLITARDLIEHDNWPAGTIADKLGVEINGLAGNDADRITTAMSKSGYDAVVYRDPQQMLPENWGDQIVVFNNSQVKVLDQAPGLSSAVAPIGPDTILIGLIPFLEQFKGVTAAANEDHSHSAMVAWYPSVGEANQLRLPDGEILDHLHCTLVYLGQSEAVPDSVPEIVAAVAARFSPFTAKISGFAVFNVEDGKCFVALLDAPELEQLQQRLHDEIAPLCDEMPDNHGFTAHITLKYLEPDDVIDPAWFDRPTPDVKIEAITTDFGTDRIDYPLATEIVLTEFGDVSGHDFHGNQHVKIDSIKPEGKGLSEKAALTAADRVVASAGKWVGKDLSDVKVQVSDAETTAHFDDKDRTIYISPTILSEIRDKEYGVQGFRQVDHEAMHAASGVQRVLPGISQTVEEGGAEILSVAHWAEQGQTFGDRDAVRTDGAWRPGTTALLGRSVYQDETNEVLARAASSVGTWDRGAVLDKVKDVFSQDHNGRLNFRDTTDPTFPPPSGVQSQGLLSWLIEGSTTASTYLDFGDTPGHDFHGNQYTNELTDALTRMKAYSGVHSHAAYNMAHGKPATLLTDEPSRLKVEAQTKLMLAEIAKSPVNEQPLFRGALSKPGWKTVGDTVELPLSEFTTEQPTAAHFARSEGNGASPAHPMDMDRQIMYELPPGTTPALKIDMEKLHANDPSLATGKGVEGENGYLVAGTFNIDRTYKDNEGRQVAVLSRSVTASAEFGDTAGHPFHGNQYIGGIGGIDKFIAEHPRLPGEDIFVWQGRIVQGLPKQTQSDLILKTRELYPPVDYIQNGMKQWCIDHNLTPPPSDLNSFPCDIKEAEAAALYFEHTPDQSGDPKVQAAYADFRAQSEEQWNFMTKPESAGGLGIKVDFTTKVDPYATAEAQAADLRENHHITLQSGLGGAHDATMAQDEYDRFRAVHDVFGHAGVGGGFDRHGEYEAWLAHASMYVGAGRDAMSTEYHGVNSALWSGDPGSPGTGKSILLPDSLSDPPWDRGVTASVTSSQEDQLIEALGLDAHWATLYSKMPWHTLNGQVVASVQALEFGDVAGHAFHGNQHVDLGEWQAKQPPGTMYRAMSRDEAAAIRGGAPIGVLPAKDTPPNAVPNRGLWVSSVAKKEYLDRGEVIAAIHVEPHEKISPGGPGDWLMKQLPSERLLGTWEPAPNEPMMPVHMRGRFGGEGYDEAEKKLKEAGILAVQQMLDFGDSAGHVFHGNQYTGGHGGSEKEGRQLGGAPLEDWQKRAAQVPKTPAERTKIRSAGMQGHTSEIDQLQVQGERIAAVLPNATIDISQNVAPKYLEAAAQSAEQFAAEFPGPAASVAYMISTDTDPDIIAQVRSVPSGENAIGWELKPSQVGMELSEKYFSPTAGRNLEEETVKMAEGDLPWHPVGTVKSLIDHEFGHVLDHADGNQYSYMTSVATRQISRYAQGSDGEAFGEAFAIRQAGLSLPIDAQHEIDAVISRVTPNSPVRDGGPLTAAVSKTETTCAGYVPAELLKEEFGDTPGHSFHGNQHTGPIAGQEYHLTYRPVSGREATKTVRARYKGIITRNDKIGPKAVFVVTDDPAHREGWTVQKELALGPDQLHQLEPVTASLVQPLEFGDAEGHGFRGNQWTGGRGGGGSPSSARSSAGHSGLGVTTTSKPQGSGTGSIGIGGGVTKKPTKKQLALINATLAQLQVRFGVEAAAKIVTEQEMSQLTGGAARAIACGGHGTIYMLEGSQIVTNDSKGLAGIDHGTLGEVGATRWLMTHEYGHLYEQAQLSPPTFQARPTSKDALYLTGMAHGGLSSYGRSNPTEAYAEAFADHAVSPSPQTLTKAYAAAFGWP